jgi:SAM-dependent methyltransferase
MRRRARIIQVVCDLAKKPISELRILDLASLEGHFSFEFASKGAQVTGIEGRQSNIEKALTLGEKLNLRAEFIKDDVRNLSSEQYGVFDVVLCLGILYHLDAPDIQSFLERLYQVCREFVVIDTHVALSSVKKLGKYSGYYFTEYAREPSPQEQEKSSWSSSGNVKSFWLTKPSLVNALADVGFTSVMEVYFPTINDIAADRVTVIAFKGKVEMPAVEFTDPKILGERLPEVPKVISHHQPVHLNNGLYSRLRRYLRSSPGVSRILA